MLFTRGLAHSQVYRERERERKVCHSSRSINLDARKRDGEVYPDISTIEISNEHRT